MVITVEEAMVMVAVVEAIKMRKVLQNIFLSLCLLVATFLPLNVLAADKDIVILYTNDIHCAIDDNEGLSGLSQYKKDVLKTTPYVALVDAGETRI
jgi:2',3'-cyclic-nucleotide 2'-phosphodiesterase (5'-nucleotidase family)